MGYLVDTPPGAPHAKISSKHRVLVVGASYSGLAAVGNLLKLVHEETASIKLQKPLQITLVDERDGFFHTIGTPLALASQEYNPKAWTKLVDIPLLQHPQITLKQGTVKSVDCATKTAQIVESISGNIISHPYDFLVACSGLRRQWPAVPKSLSRERYLEEVNAHIEDIKRLTGSVLIIGGGAVGIEMAAELKLVLPSQSIILIHSQEKILSNEPLPDEFKDTTLDLLRKGGVEVILSERVIESEANDTESKGFTVVLGSGKTLHAGKVIWALSKSIPSTTFFPSELLDKDGYVKITSQLSLQPSFTSNSSHHFVAGDIASWSGIKRCGAAIAMGNLAAGNVYQQMQVDENNTTPKFAEFPEVPPMIALAIGKNCATYDPVGGVSAGEEQMKVYFGDDLGLTICWNYMQLDNTGYGGLKTDVLNG